MASDSSSDDDMKFEQDLKELFGDVRNDVQRSAPPAPSDFRPTDLLKEAVRRVNAMTPPPPTEIRHGLHEAWTAFLSASHVRDPFFVDHSLGIAVEALSKVDDTKLRDRIFAEWLETTPALKKQLEPLANRWKQDPRWSFTGIAIRCTVLAMSVLLATGLGIAFRGLFRAPIGFGKGEIVSVSPNPNSNGIAHPPTRVDLVDAELRIESKNVLGGNPDGAGAPRLVAYQEQWEIKTNPQPFPFGWLVAINERGQMTCDKIESSGSAIEVNEKWIVNNGKGLQYFIVVFADEDHTEVLESVGWLSESVIDRLKNMSRDAEGLAEARKWVGIALTELPFRDRVRFELQWYLKSGD